MVEVSFPVAFIVDGTPVSAQAKRPASRTAWQAKVRDASLRTMPQNHFCTERPVSVTILVFPIARMAGDIDNVVKPILDALCRTIYLDDAQVERVWVQKFEPGRAFPLSAALNVSAILQYPRPFVFVRLSDDPNEGLA
jgi:hypothetical protein